MRISSYPYVIVRVRCLGCERQGAYRLARLAAKYGPECGMQEVLNHLTSDCGWRYEKAWSMVSECKAFFPDLSGPPRPPDLPPGHAPLRLIKGGVPDIGPVMPLAERKKRAGG